MPEREIVLTEEGHSKLIEELHFLETTRRREVAERIKESIQFGDLSENSEFDDAKNEQAFVEGRIIQINDILSRARVVGEDGAGSGQVTIGSHVVLLDLESNEKEEYQLVGSAEADPTNHRISNESPVGRAIIDRKAGEIVKVVTPEGDLEYKIVKVKRHKR